jgi:hypothetical protein
VLKTSLILLVITTLALTGCQSTGQPKSTKLPSWVTSPPQDTANIFYGLGSGYDLQTANAAALKDVSSKLGVTVSSIYKQRQQVTNQNYQKYIDDQVQLSTEQTPITQYQVIHNESFNQNFYSLIKVEKIKILKASEDKLKQQNELATKMLNKEASSSDLIWFTQSNDLLKSNGQSAYRFAAIINLLSPEKDINTNLSPWGELSKKVAKQQQNLCIALVDENKKSSDFINVLKESLSKQQIKVTQHCKEKILVKAQEQQSYLFNKYVSSNDINFELINKNSDSVSSHSFTISGQSVSNYANARKAAVAQLKRKLEQQSIWQILAITQ